MSYVRTQCKLCENINNSYLVPRLYTAAAAAALLCTSTYRLSLTLSTLINLLVYLFISISN